MGIQIEKFSWHKYFYLREVKEIFATIPPTWSGEDEDFWTPPELRIIRRLCYQDAKLEIFLASYL